MLENEGVIVVLKFKVLGLLNGGSINWTANQKCLISPTLLLIVGVILL